MNLILFSSKDREQPLPQNDPRAEHILNVLKIAPGHSFDVGQINGPRGKARLMRIENQKLYLEYFWQDEIPTLYPIDLWVSFSRPQTCRRILQECTSLGVRSLNFFDTEKCEPTYRDSRLWSTNEAQRLLIRGAEQAFCTRIPKLNLFSNLRESLTQLTEVDSKLALDNYEATGRLGCLNISGNSFALAVGGERGWSSTERHILRDSGFLLASLGPRVQRTDTACIAAVSILTAQLAGK